MKSAIAVLNKSEAQGDDTTIANVLSDLETSLTNDMNEKGITSTPDRIYIFVVVEEA